MVVRSVPENGDIVVRQETCEGALVYILHAASGPDQYLLHGRDEAVAHAETFAKRDGVRAWLVCGESDFVLLGESRRRQTLKPSIIPQRLRCCARVDEFPEVLNM